MTIGEIMKRDRCSYQEAQRKLSEAIDVVVGSVQAVCKWRSDGEVGWKTHCGEAFVFNDDGPRENRFNFCPYCGGVLKL